MVDELIKLIDRYETLYIELQDLRALAQEFDTKHKIVTYRCIAAKMESNLNKAIKEMRID